MSNTLPTELEASMQVMSKMLEHVNMQIEVHTALLRDYKKLRDTLVEITDNEYAENVRKFESLRRNLAPNMDQQTGQG